MPRPMCSKSAHTRVDVEVFASARASSSMPAHTSSTLSVIASTSAPFEPKWLKTVARTTPACSATSLMVTASKPRLAKSSRAASRMRSRWPRRSSARFGIMDPSLIWNWTRVQSELGSRGGPRGGLGSSEIGAERRAQGLGAGALERLAVRHLDAREAEAAEALDPIPRLRATPQQHAASGERGPEALPDTHHPPEDAVARPRRPDVEGRVGEDQRPRGPMQERDLGHAALRPEHRVREHV